MNDEVKDEAKTAISILFRNFDMFTRHMFSGLVAVFLFEIGNSGAKSFSEITIDSDLNFSKVVCYALAALVVGNLTYLLSRYVICAIIMCILHKSNPDKYSRGLKGTKSVNYLVEIGNFAQYRWSEDFPPKLNEYLVRAWGWIHGMGSVAIVVISIPLYFMMTMKKDATPFKGWSVGICIFLVVVLFVLSYLHNILMLLSMEHIAYMQRFDKIDRFW